MLLAAALRVAVRAVIEVLVHRLIGVVFGDAGVNFLRRHALEAVEDQRAGRRLEAVLDQQRVDGEVAGDVPALLDPVLAPREMREGAVQRLVGEDELGLFQAQGVDVVGVVIEAAGVRCGSLAPLRIGGDHRQSQRQRAEERLVQNQPGAGRSQLGFDGAFLTHHSSHFVQHQISDGIRPFGKLRHGEQVLADGAVHV